MNHLNHLTLIVALTILTASLFAQDTTLTITSNGKVGIGTTTPLGKLEVVGDGSAWHEGFLFLKNDDRDAGIRLYDAPNQVKHHIFNNNVLGDLLRIVPDSVFGSGGINLTQGGHVGIGTTSPLAALHVESGGGGRPPQIQLRQTDDGGFTVLRFENSTEQFWDIAESPDDQLRFFSGSGIVDVMTLTSGGNVGIGTINPIQPLEMASGAHVTVGGVWTDASSRQYKENISNLSDEEAISALAGLNPVKYNYKVQKDEEYIGFIAEDVPDLVATGDRNSLSPMDIVAVLTKVVQQQQQKIAELEARLNAAQ